MKNILCDHKCPLHESCGRYLEGLDRTTTFHLDPMPYKADRNRCNKFIEIDIDLAIERVNEILKPYKDASDN